ncbi:capsule assembly Wzi family protein, partial [Treponema sp. JC4]|uniref:capsule assembly Wzi family protein n=1 Tax=Treponema sp. JC4 TaxID=1124982 RepID=UPI00068321D8
LLLPSFLVTALYSQEALKSIEEEYYDFLSLTGIVERPTLGYRTLSDSEWNFIDENEELPSHPWQNNNLETKFTLRQGAEGSNWFTRGFAHSLKLKIYGPGWYNSFNTAVPYGQNDGALWQGKGYNTSLTGGARLEAFGFELTVKPIVCFSQNLDFAPLGNVYGNNYGAFFGQNIDLVERYGNSAFWTFDWGDTEVRYSWRTFTVGFGTQSPWLGPAWLNPMLGSNNAASYPKVDIGLRRTKVYLPFCNWYIGDIEGRIWTGMLKQSDYYNFTSDYNNRMVNAMSASYSPSFIPGFTIGLNRIFMTKWKAENLKYIARLFTTSRDNAINSDNSEDQKFSIFADWQFPKVGFEVYGEFGRDDFSSNEDTNPFHTAIYTIGAKQYIPIKLTKLFPKWKNAFNLDTEIIFEWNNFEMSQDFQLQWIYLGYYAHSPITQGYTNKGQIIGAGSGAFGNSQFLGWRIYYPKGSTMLYFHRFCPNNNSVYSKAVNTSSDAVNGDIYKTWYANFETYFVLGFNTNYFVTPALNASLGFAYMKIFRYHYTNETKHNCQISAGLKYSL